LAVVVVDEGRMTLRHMPYRLVIALRRGVAVTSLMITVASAISAVAPQETFATPEVAVDALVAANRSNHTDELLAILGPQSAKLINSGDPVADRDARARFVTAYDVAHKLERDADNKAVLIVGAEEWPAPIPLVREHDRWHFDTKAGSGEILNRRIGRDELTVIQICRAYIAAQREYAAMRFGPGGSPEYAQHFTSAVGRHDGLYWPVNPGETESPLGPMIAQARAAGYRPGTPHLRPRPYYGYYFWILTRQGENAAGGARNYIVEGHMTGGFALLAYPATYGDSGIMTFLVGDTGIVYEKNLGPRTASIAAQIAQYDPDASWQPSKP
jgi:hypothetical protein